MNSIETLKQELLAQKSAIEEKGSTVNVANLNPSPSEITQAIRDLNIPNFTITTAKEEDVAQGKTFFSGNSEVKIGTFDENVMLRKTLLFDSEVATETERVYYTIPSMITELRDYAFYKNYNPLTITLNDNISELGKYAFSNCPDLQIPNFTTSSNLKKIGDFCFFNSPTMSEYLDALPVALEIIKQKAFGDVTQDGNSIIIPETVTLIEQYAFTSTDRKELKELKLPQNYTNSLPVNGFNHLGFDCDCEFPAGVTIVPSSFNYRGSFNNVTIHSGIKTVQALAFGSASTDAISGYRMKTITFESATVPLFGKNTIATQHITNGLKIYVPDEAVDEYKTASNFTTYASKIYPVSEKE